MLTHICFPLVLVVSIYTNMGYILGSTSVLYYDKCWKLSALGPGIALGLKLLGNIRALA